MDFIIEKAFISEMPFVVLIVDQIIDMAFSEKKILELLLRMKQDNIDIIFDNKLKFIIRKDDNPIIIGINNSVKCH